MCFWSIQRYISHNNNKSCLVSSPVITCGTKKYCLFPLFRPPDKIGLTIKCYRLPGKKKKLFRNFFWFRSGNERKLFVQFQFGILLELRMTSSKVIEANPYRKAITTMDTTWCVSAVENWKGWKKTLNSNALKEMCPYVCKIWTYLI
jgi:hypothetical protein